MILASVWLRTWRRSAARILILSPVGGLMRLLQPGYTVVTDLAFTASLLAEFVAAPLFGLWLLRQKETQT